MTTAAGGQAREAWKEMSASASKPSALGLATAAYRYPHEDQDWIDGVLAAARGFDVGGGVAAYTVRLGETSSVETAATPASQDEHAALTALRLVTASFTEHAARAVYAPTEFAGNARWRLQRILSAARGKARTRLEAALPGLPSMWTLLVGGGERVGLALCFLSPHADTEAATPFPHAGYKQLGLAGAHLGSALRLRRGLRELGPDTADAVLDREGRVLHAEGSAKTLQRSLTEAVRRSPHAARRAVPDDEALGMWQALVQGRWSLVDFVDRDGKRFVLARRNPHGGAAIRGLDALELDVSRLAALGHSYKYIGYELGISRSTVVRKLQRAIEKLGVSDRRELARHFGAGAK